MWNIIFLISGAIFIALLLYIFNSKDIINSQENKAFKKIMLSNVLGYLMEIPLQIIVRTLGIDHFTVDFLIRVYLISISLSCTIFTFYVFIICLKKESEKYNKKLKIIKNVLSTIQTVLAFLFILLPFTKVISESKMFIDGDALNLLKIYIGIDIIIYVAMLIYNFKKLRDLSLITGDKGRFTINPQIFWKGEMKVRNQLLKEEAVQISFKIG